MREAAPPSELTPVPHRSLIKPPVRRVGPGGEIATYVPARLRGGRKAQVPPEQHIDDANDGALAVERRGGPTQDFHALDGRQRQGSEVVADAPASEHVPRRDEGRSVASLAVDEEDDLTRARAGDPERVDEVGRRT